MPNEKATPHLELGLELFDEPDASTGVGRDVDPRQAQFAGVLGSGLEELVLFITRSGSSRARRKIIPNTEKEWLVPYIDYLFTARVAGIFAVFFKGIPLLALNKEGHGRRVCLRESAQPAAEFDH